MAGHLKIRARRGGASAPAGTPELPGRVVSSSSPEPTTVRRRSSTGGVRRREREHAGA
jgi:hypothetical protein